MAPEPIIAEPYYDTYAFILSMVSLEFGEKFTKTLDNCYVKGQFEPFCLDMLDRNILKGYLCRKCMIDVVIKNPNCKCDFYSEKDDKIAVDEVIDNFLSGENFFSNDGNCTEFICIVMKYHHKPNLEALTQEITALKVVKQKKNSIIIKLTKFVYMFLFFFKVL